MRPGSAFAPFINAGLGAAHIRPKADNFIDAQETLMALSAGGAAGSIGRPISVG